MIETKLLCIYGAVQGVGFRVAMAREAQRLDLTGWVRNRADGSVEAIVQGPAEAVAQMLEWAKRGPRGASVSRVEVADGEGVHPEFSVLATR
jgi:acylphosphatase